MVLLALGILDCSWIGGGGGDGVVGLGILDCSWIGGGGGGFSNHGSDLSILYTITNFV
jgi:hypothetical protein